MVTLNTTMVVYGGWWIMKLTRDVKLLLKHYFHISSVQLFSHLQNVTVLTAPTNPYAIVSHDSCTLVQNKQAYSTTSYSIFNHEL